MTRVHSSSISVAIFIAASYGAVCRGPCHAEVIVSPASYFNNTMGVWSGNGGVNTMDLAIDQSGLSTGFVSGVTDLTSYLGANPTHQSTATSYWISASGAAGGSVDFDLGSTLPITRFVLWQANEYADEQIDGFTIFTSSVSDFSSSTDVGSFNATDTPSVALHPRKCSI